MSRQRVLWPVALGLLASPLLAQAQADPTPVGTWRFQATPYVWMSGLQGNVRPLPQAPRVAVDTSFSERMDSLEGAALLTATAGHDDGVLQADLRHVRTADSVALPYGLAARTRVQQDSVSLTAGRALSHNAGNGIDLLAGLRYWDVRASVAVPGLGSARATTAVLDPVAAVRWRKVLGPRLSRLADAEVGGFGLGSERRTQWLLLANYHWRPQAVVSLGYRHQHLDYRDDGKQLDLRLSGPMLGVTWLFDRGRLMPL